MEGDSVFLAFPCVEAKAYMKFYSYVVGGNKCLVFLEGIFEEIFGKLLINGKKAIFGTDAGKKIFVFEIYSEA